MAKWVGGIDDDPDRVSQDVAQAVSPEIPTLYWRPGCSYCSRLRHRLHKLGVQVTEINIWEDPAAAEQLRRITGGSETVPTVMIGGKSLVNPTATAVVDLLEARPVRPAAREQARPRATRNLLQWVTIGAVMAASFMVDGFGNHALSWGLDGLALVVYGAFRLTRA